MGILIDGYNLLHASGILGRGQGPGSFERSRQALLNFLAASLDEEQRQRTVVVFDATAAPPGLPRASDHRGLSVRFAVGYENADALIIELIRRDSAPRQLTVVSSDHEIRRAARRRRARAVASDEWFRELLQRRSATQRRRLASSQPEKPGAPLSEEQVEYWTAVFAESLGELPSDESDAESQPSMAASDTPRETAPPDVATTSGRRIKEPGSKPRTVEPAQSTAPPAPSDPQRPDEATAGDEQSEGESTKPTDWKTAVDEQLLADASALLAEGLNSPFSDAYRQAIEKELLSDNPDASAPPENDTPPRDDVGNKHGRPHNRRR